MSETWLAGAALSNIRGETDYTAGSLGQARLETRLTAVYPYVRGEFDSGLELWAMGGYGWGDAVVERTQGPPGAGDLTLGMGAFGARQGLFSWRGLQFATVGGAGLLSLSSDEDEGLNGGVSVAVQQARLAMELSLPMQGLSPYAELGGRFDGGDGRTGMGVEAVAGVRHSGARIDFEARGRWLTAVTDDNHEERGAMARLALRSRPDGSGWTMALSPRWGASDGGALLGAGQAAGGAWFGGDYRSLHSGMADTLALDWELGYGFESPRLKGMLTPVVSYGRMGAGQSLARVGFAYQSLQDRLSRDLAIEFSIGREQRHGVDADHQVHLTLTMWPWGLLPSRTALPTALSGVTAATEADGKPDARDRDAPPDDAPAEPSPANGGPHPADGSANGVPMTPLFLSTPVEARPPAVSASAAALLELPATHYAVQLVALRTESELQDLVARYGLDHLIRTRIDRDGEAFHVLLLGVYADIDDARRAVAALPPRLRDITPWVRPLGSLREAMQRVRP